MADFNRLKDYLHEFILTDDQLKMVYTRFCEDVKKGLCRETRPNADSKCFVTYVQDLPTGDEIGKYLALDLGGSNFRVLLVTLKGAHEASITSKLFALPAKVITGPGVKLFDHIANCLAEFIEENDLKLLQLPLGLTFSFPCMQVSLTKAVLVRWTKGFTCSGVENKDVGRLLKEAIGRCTSLHIDVLAILNDTTGTLMSCAHRNPDCRIGLIVGTGCNACYVERVENVDMLEEEYKQKPNVIINVEWGAFGEGGALEFIRTDIDREIDSKSLNKGKQIFEKMLSGMYLGNMVRILLLRVIRENLAFFTCCSVRNKIANILTYQLDCIETRHISQVEGDKGPDFNNTRKVLKEIFGLEMPLPEDIEKFRFICEVVSKRSAFLVGIGISGLINKIGEEKTVVAVDGTLFRLHPKFSSYMKQIMTTFVDSNIKFELMLSEDGSGRGAALVAAVASSAP